MLRAIWLAALCAAGAFAQNGTRAGRFVVEHPTLLNLGFEWSIEGDANRNAAVAVNSAPPARARGGLRCPLVRIGGERVFRKMEGLEYTVPDGFAGSILNLLPGTEYECRFTMTRSRRRHRRGRPKRSACGPGPSRSPRNRGGRCTSIPPDYQGKKEEPSLHQHAARPTTARGSATGASCGRSGRSPATRSGARRPVRNDRLNYVDPLATPFDGTMSLTLKGTAEKPITIKAAGDGEVIFDGAGNHRLFDVMASQHHIFEGLTFRNTDVAIFAGQKEVRARSRLTVKNCRFENVGFGVWTEYAGSSDFYIADNLFLGRDDRFRLIGWTGPRWASAGPVRLPPADQLLRDQGLRPGSRDRAQRHRVLPRWHRHLDLRHAGEGSGAAAPRRSTSTATTSTCRTTTSSRPTAASTTSASSRIAASTRRRAGTAAQPMFGGPVYFIRNLLYHVPAGWPLKFSSQTGRAVRVSQHLHRRADDRGPRSNAHFRNNLFLGRDTPGRGIMTWANATAHTARTTTAIVRIAASRRSTRGSARRTRTSPNARTGRSSRRSRSSAPPRARRRTASRSTSTSSSGWSRPTRRSATPSITPMDLDFRLKPGGKAVDAGVALPTVNDGFVGSRAGPRRAGSRGR